ncbi:hypothetical protein HYT95_01915 [Candidatus Peregrinibacteria bacterium]|nr:hypothetical protein [Candidatus Peregrinibacteria bacterium]
MSTSPPIITRAQKKWQRKLQEGTILSYTTIRAENTLTTIALIRPYVRRIPSQPSPSLN